MQSSFVKFILAVGLLTGSTIPALAQSDAQIGALVEALNRADEAMGDRAWTDWQAENIPRWSSKCIGRSLTPEQFEASPVTARWISVCILRDIFKTEFRLNQNNEAIAIRRAAAWWNTGNPNRFNTGETASYTQKVLSFYQQKKANPTPSAPTNAPAQAGSATPATKPGATRSTPDGAIVVTPEVSSSASLYDRYMKAGYEATNRRDNPTALLYFKRALDERPEDSYATQAIRNVETYLNHPPASSTSAPPTSPTSPSSQSSPSSPSAPVSPAPKPAQTKLSPPPKPPTVKPTTAAATPKAVVLVPAAPTSDAFNEQQAIDLINRWLQAKVEIFAPPYDQQQVNQLTTGELLTSLVKPNGVLTWLKTNRAYFRYGAQKVDSIERFVVARDRATLELNLTEDRTLYLNGTIDPQQTDFSRQRLRFTFVAEDGTWKIADYKTVSGSLLERSILGL